MALGAVLALSLGSLSAQAATSVPNSQELAQHRFQLPNPMSREYLQGRRSAPVRYEAPVDSQTPVQPRPAPYTN